jgi:transcriptional regulator with XRE-family HTH domain
MAINFVRTLDGSDDSKRFQPMERVRQLRDKRSWSQEELAHRSGLARSFTGAIERGEKDVRLSTLVKLANTFSVPMTGLFE